MRLTLEGGLYVLGATPHAVWFEDVGSQDAGLAGGKGANPGEWTCPDLPVPSGSIFITQAYYSAEANLNDKLSALFASLDTGDRDALATGAQQILREALVIPSYAREI